MAEVREPDISSLVDEVLKRLGTPASVGAGDPLTRVPRTRPSSTAGPVYPTVNDAVAGPQPPPPPVNDHRPPKPPPHRQPQRAAGK